MTNRGLLYAVLTGYLISVLFAVGAVVYAVYVDTQSNRRWCDLVVTLDDTYSLQRPTTDLGVRLATSIKNIRQEFGC